MSFFKKLNTQIKDKSCLISGLKSLGYNPIETGAKQAVRGHGSEKLSADIVLRKEDLKTGGDVGFNLLANGAYDLVLDTYVVKLDTKDFLAKTTDAYNRAQIKKLMAQFPGYQMVQDKNVNGETVIRYEQVYA